MNIKERLRNFFSGRYGYDELNRFLLVIYSLIIIIYLFTKAYWLNLTALVVFIVLIFRLLSKNYEKRRAENRKFMVLTAPVRSGIKNMRSSYKSDHKVFSCPGCGQRVRVPKGKGRIEIKCPKCSKTFLKRS